MVFESFPKIPRYSREIIVTEKIDGTNAGILIEDLGNNSTRIRAASRKRFITPESDNFGFAAWVENNKEELIEKLGFGWHYGEWYGYKIQREYGLKEKRFVLFNVRRWFDDTVRPSCCDVVPILYKGDNHTNEIISAMNQLTYYGSVLVPGYTRPEGVVIFHTASQQLYKKTFDGDKTGKEE